MITLRISIHAPARGATLPFQIFDINILISIHAPARGATQFQVFKLCSNNNFNPRSREGSDDFSVSAFTNFLISIHAPARGATLTKKACR